MRCHTKVCLWSKGYMTHVGERVVGDWGNSCLLITFYMFIYFSRALSVGSAWRFQFSFLSFMVKDEARRSRTPRQWRVGKRAQMVWWERFHQIIPFLVSLPQTVLSTVPLLIKNRGWFLHFQSRITLISLRSNSSHLIVTCSRESLNGSCWIRVRIKPLDKIPRSVGEKKIKRSTLTARVPLSKADWTSQVELREGRGLLTVLKRTLLVEIECACSVNIVWVSKCSSNLLSDRKPFVLQTQFLNKHVNAVMEV